MTSAAIYARVSSARQARDETIGSQLAALREHAERSRLDVPGDWVFADEGHSGATLVRPGLEGLRDLAARGCPDVVLVYSPDLWVPTISSTSRDQAIFVDHATVRVCLRTRYWPRMTGCGSGFSGAAECSERCGRC
jgi:DNA invertase Pin-like site-specific DNA recombinase